MVPQAGGVCFRRSHFPVFFLAICSSFCDKAGSSGTVFVRKLFFLNLRFEVVPARAGNRSVRKPAIFNQGTRLESDGDTGDCTPCPFHTTGHAVFRIRRLNPAEVTP
ncbi:MAG: hypothetical protein PHR34_06240, partial [Kiritimatiellae bacterium]|nr:hypothetical protein [Kiritimatiellia bacterium]